MQRVLLPSLVLVLGLMLLNASLLSRVAPDDLPVVEWNDNREAAGTWVDGELHLALEVKLGNWFVAGPDHPAGQVLAFGEVGKPLQNPGPMIRVPEGTAVRVSITNPLESNLVIHGLGERRVASMDPVVIPAGATREVRFIADSEGAYYYWASTTGLTFNRRRYEDSQLHGALIVDPADPAAREDDRVLVISAWVQAKNQRGNPDFWTEFLTINGRPWPLTERFSHAMGDSIRWRLINASPIVHPMHLHGFYYRIDSRGDMARDTLYWPAERRMAVTERMDPGTTMSMVWSPDRPGGWIFHCHLNFHVITNPGVGDEMVPTPERIRQVFFGDDHHDPKNHVVEGMGGLLLAVNVREPEGWQPPTPRRHMRLFVQSASIPGDSAVNFAYVLQEGPDEPAPDSVRLPGSTLVLQRGEPTSVWVINRSPEPTQVHWHGLEIESYYDGVTGVGGFRGMPTPPIMPGDSFEMRVTPPRSGSFMYHTHVNDVYQQRMGLYGALLVVDSAAAWNPAVDHVFLIGSGTEGEPILNGTTEHDTLTLGAGETHRFRLMNITIFSPGIEAWLVRDGAAARWKLLAKDGHDVPTWQSQPIEAQQAVSIGETYDVEVRLAPGDYELEIRGGNGRLFTTKPIRVERRLRGGR